MKMTKLITRIREKMIRLLNAVLLRMLVALYRKSGLGTTYHVNHQGVTATFEGLKFHYSFADFGCTGNIDFNQRAENDTRKALRSVIGTTDVFYDIGAHGGVYSLTLKDAVPELVVHSFEPLPEELIVNFGLNRCSIQNVHQVAVGDTHGVARMTTSFRSSNHVGTEDEPGDREVPIVRLDDYVASNGLPAPTWIKIDIEGMELPAMRGAEKVLRSSMPVVICEINHLLTRFGADLQNLTAYMDSLGYDFFRLDGKGNLKRISLPCTNLAELGWSSDNNFWFVPRIRTLPPLML